MKNLRRRRKARISRGTQKNKLSAHPLFRIEWLESRRMLSGATILLSDQFSGNVLNSGNWHSPVYNPDGSTYIPNTQFQVNPYLPPVSNGQVGLNLQTYNPSARTPGDSFFGTEIITNQQFNVNNGLQVDVTMAVAPGTPGGIVCAPFLYGPPDGNGNHNEIDFELLTNNPNQVQTNVYANQPGGVGSPTITVLPNNGNQTQFYTYQILWLPNAVQWSVNGHVIRTETSLVPTGPMSLYLNMYAPNQATFAAAYNMNLQPATTQAGNQIYYSYAKSVVITQLPAPVQVAWTGKGDGVDWNNAANWSNNSVPTSNAAVTIPTATVVQLGSGTFAVAALTLQGTATLNLGTGTLEIDFGDPGVIDPIATIQSYIQTGYNNDQWKGSGITSSTAAANPGLYAIGYADGNSDIGTPAVAGQIYITTTLAGDANLDGVVNFPDLLVVAQNYGKSGQDWTQGDFNYDGVVNFPDLLLVAQNYGKVIAANQTEQTPSATAIVAPAPLSEDADENGPTATEAAPVTSETPVIMPDAIGAAAIAVSAPLTPLTGAETTPPITTAPPVAIVAPTPMAAIQPFSPAMPIAVVRAAKPVAVVPSSRIAKLPNVIITRPSFAATLYDIGGNGIVDDAVVGTWSVASANRKLFFADAGMLAA